MHAESDKEPSSSNSAEKQAVVIDNWSSEADQYPAISNYLETEQSPTPSAMEKYSVIEDKAIYAINPCEHSFVPALCYNICSIRRLKIDNPVCPAPAQGRAKVFLC